jgi:hypothetical protein
MTGRNKFEEMLELLINEDKEGAKALFHEIVVEKSRDIYESLLEDEEEVEEASDEEVDESEDDDLEESDDEDLDESADEEVDESEDDDLDEMFGLDQFEADANQMDPMAAMGGDATDDMMGDIEMGGDEEGESEGGADSAFADLEAALDALKAEFEAMMGDEEGDDMDMDMDDEGDEEEDDDEEEKESYAFEAEDEDDEEEVEESRRPKTAGEQMREYVEKVTAKMGDNGTNTKSIVAGKNDMGGTTANIAKSSTEAGVEANKGQLKGNGVLKGSVKDMNTKNVNVVGAKAATKMTAQPGHGAEKKGKPETADKSAGSMLNGAPKRAK